MKKKVLLTSFTTWLPEQKSNSSDDLLQEISKRDIESYVSTPYLIFLRRLPVDIQLASNLVITKINELKPDAVISCGMSRRRPYLSIESNATSADEILYTDINLDKLLDGIDGIKISHNAGKFVCEGLYYSILKHIFDTKIRTHCIFVHVPILTEENMNSISNDFILLLQRIACS